MSWQIEVSMCVPGKTDKVWATYCLRPARTVDLGEETAQAMSALGYFLGSLAKLNLGCEREVKVSIREL